MKTYESRTFQALASQCLGKELARGDAHLLQPFIDIFPVDIGIGKRKVLRGYQTVRKAERFQKGKETSHPTAAISQTDKWFLENDGEHTPVEGVRHHEFGLVELCQPLGDCQHLSSMVLGTESLYRKMELGTQS